MSIAERIAALNVGHVGRAPGTPPIPHPPNKTLNVAAPPSIENNAQNVFKAPKLPPRAHSIDKQSNQLRDPSQTSHNDGSVGNEPDYQPTATHGVIVPSNRPEHSRSRAPVLPPRKPSVLSTPSKTSVHSISSTTSPPSTRRTSTADGASSIPLADFINGFRQPVSSVERQSSTITPLRVPDYDSTALPPLPSKRAEQQPPPVPRRVSNGVVVANEVFERVQPRPRDAVARQDVSDTIRSTVGIPAAKSGLPSKSALDWGLNKGPAYKRSATEKPTIPSASRPAIQPAVQAVVQPPIEDVPPPIPIASRPNLAQLQASKPKPTTSSSQASYTSPTNPSTCLHCRDFTAPDTHAARFPRTAIPSTDLHYLAHHLTKPCPSPTDKARAIFTWLHHNIAYDTAAFFSNKLYPSTPSSTIASGLAVCEGYAGLFTALAISAGLESVVISGHGKGFGYEAVTAGAPIPSFDPNHAWSAINLSDTVGWKLIDPCWGAGNLDDTSHSYKKHFRPSMFAMLNTEFGLRHFPSNPAHFFLPPATAPPNWEDYMLGPDGGPGAEVQVYGFAEQESLSTASFSPRKQTIRHSAGVLRFQFSAICPHWYAPPSTRTTYVFMLSRPSAPEGEQLLPFRRSGDGDVWWIDVDARTLVKGETVTCVAVTDVEGRDARGLGEGEVSGAVGRKAMSWQGVAAWVVG